MNSANYNQMMAELREEYLVSFDEKFNAMRGFLEGADWYSLELEFHKLKGTGTTYGVPEVTELCEIMEKICREKSQIDESLLNLAISLLSKIREKYTNGTDFDLGADPQFQAIKNN